MVDSERKENGTDSLSTLFAWEKTKVALGELGKLLKCHACKCIAKDPQEYTMCGHFFCKSCIKGYATTCAVCGVPSKACEIVSDRLIGNTIEQWEYISKLLNIGKDKPEETDHTSSRGEERDNENVTHAQSKGSTPKSKQRQSRDSARSNSRQNKNSPSVEKPVRQSDVEAANSSEKVTGKVLTRKSINAEKQPKGQNKRSSVPSPSTDSHHLKACQSATTIPHTPSSKKYNKESPSTPIQVNLRNRNLNCETPCSSTKSPRSETPAHMKKNAKGETPLHVACIKGDVNRVKFFLEAGANPNVKDNAGWTPLHEAANHGFVEVAELLLKNGACVDIPGVDNETPLHDAVQNNRVDAARLLVSYGADVNARSVQGRTPRDLAYTEAMKEALNTKVMVSPNTSSVQCSSQAVPSRVVLLCCGLKTNEKQILTKLSKIVKGKVVHDFTSDVTHVVVSALDQNFLEPSMPVLQGILQGKWVVKLDWARLCLDMKEIVNPEPFELTGTRDFPNTETPKKARLNAQKQLPGIFSGCHFYFSGTFGAPLQKNQLSALARSGDGIVLTREPDPEYIPAAECTVPYHAHKDSLLSKCSHYIIYQEGKSEPELKYNMQHIKTLPLIWFMSCILNFEIMEPF